jgi:hypothetical protein
MGGHLIERNRIHANWWAVYSEAEWDQGSIIRENLAWDNANQLVLNPGNTVSPLSDMTRNTSISAGSSTPRTTSCPSIR